MTTNNQENGGIPSIDDTTSRNIVGEGVERKNSKLIKTVFVFSIVALLAGGLFMTVMNFGEQDKQQVELKKDEAIPIFCLILLISVLLSNKFIPLK
mgnify:CR=1 FL=1